MGENVTVIDLSGDSKSKSKKNNILLTVTVIGLLLWLVVYAVWGLIYIGQSEKSCEILDKHDLTIFNIFAGISILFAVSVIFFEIKGGHISKFGHLVFIPIILSIQLGISIPFINIMQSQIENKCDVNIGLQISTWCSLGISIFLILFIMYKQLR